MDIKNTSDFPDSFLRKCLSFCCKELGYPVRDIRQLTARKRGDGRTSGRAWLLSRRIHLSIGPKLVENPTSAMTTRSVPHDKRRARIDKEGLNEITEKVVFVMGHEVGHQIDYRKKCYSGADEAYCDKLGEKCKKAFLERKYELLAVWWANTEKLKKKRKTQADKLAEAKAKIKLWERKKKLAETKLKTWRKKVKYYERQLVAQKEGKDEGDS